VGHPVHVGRLAPVVVGEDVDLAEPRVVQIGGRVADPRGRRDEDAPGPMKLRLLARGPAEDAADAVAAVFQRHQERVARVREGRLRTRFRSFPGHALTCDIRGSASGRGTLDRYTSILAFSDSGNEVLLKFQFYVL